MLYANVAVIVADQSIAKIICATSIEVPWIALALQNINVKLGIVFEWLAEP